MMHDSSDTALREQAPHALWLFGTEYFFWWFGYAVQSFYNAIQKPWNAAVLILSTAIVIPLIMVVVLWPPGLNSLWLNQADTCVPVGISAFFLLRQTRKFLSPYM